MQSKYQVSSIKYKVPNGFATLLLFLTVVAAGLIIFFVMGIFDLGTFKKIPTSDVGQISEDQQTQDLKKLSNSDEIGDIEKDLNSTSLDKIDQELPQVDQLSNDL